MKSFKFFAAPIVMCALLILTSATEGSKETERVIKATTVVRDFGKMKESIPSDLLKQAEGIVIIPNMINAGLAVGGKRGKGVAMVKNADGTWSNPVFVVLTGGSFGLQIGVQSVDLVLLFKHNGTLTKMGRGDFTIGGDVSVAAGPVGRSSSANTDYKLEAEVYSYSRSRGLFAGVSVHGSNIAVDRNANTSFYGGATSATELFASKKSSEANVVELKSALSAL